MTWLFWAIAAAVALGVVVGVLVTAPWSSPPERVRLLVGSTLLVIFLRVVGRVVYGAGASWADAGVDRMSQRWLFEQRKAGCRHGRA